MDKQKRFEELLRKKGIRAPKGPQLTRRNEPGPYKLSFAQRRIWFLQQFDLESGAYNDPTALRIKGPLNIPVLEKSLTEIVKRHQVLQMNFPSQNGQPVQVLNPIEHVPVPVIPLESDPGFSLDEQITRFVNDFSAKPFDLTKDHLFRAKLLKIQEDDYALVVNKHHIVLDGWSKGIMLEELMTLYRTFSEGKPSPLPPLPIQYTDYVSWHHEWVEGKIYQDQMAYWKENLAGAPPILELPTDHPRPAVPSGDGSVEPFILTKEQFQALTRTAKQEDVTLFMLLTTAYNTLLYRYSGQEDISFGTPIAGRNRVEIEKLIGLFLNTLVIRNDLSGEPTFKEFLKRVRKTALGAYSNQDMPFENLVEELNPQRDLSVNPLFQVMFQLQNAPMPPAHISGLTIEPIQIDTGFAQVDLSLTMWEEDHTLRGQFEFNTDLYDHDTIKRMITHFTTLLDEIVADPDRPISGIPIIPENELRQIMVQWNDTRADYPRDACVYRLLEDCAAEYPQNIAVHYEDEKQTYDQLNRRANQLARYLEKFQVGPGVHTSICMENSLDLITGVAGILKTGGSYIPLDPEYPDERLHAILEDARPRVLITQQGMVDRFNNFPGKIICLDSEKEILQKESDQNKPNNCKPTDAACVIFTSGSTGKPKGIVLENRSIVNLIYSFIKSYTPGPGDSVLPLTSIASASFVGEILPVLSSGGSIVLADKVHFLDMKKLASLLTHYSVTILSTVPSMIARLNAVGWKADKLRLLLSGGEALSAGDIDHIPSSVTVVNGYGLTEATICTTYNIVNQLDLSKNPVISVGKPIINNRVYILDKQQYPVPIGVPGEIYIAGDGLAKGYLNNDELDRERFLPNPFEEGQRIFRTGDLGSWLPDGTIKFLGRIDTQVQIHGHRIELSEIETHLGLHPQIQDVVVIDREITPGDKRLVAYIVPEKQEKISSNQLREWLGSRMPEYMIPSLFETLDSIPLNANGKADVKALPIPVGLRPELDVDFKAPQGDIENKIADAWKEFLHVEKVGIEDNFFDLGGHSLLLTQVHNRLSQVFEKELTIVDLFRYPTIHTLAKYIGQEKEQKVNYSEARTRADKQRQAFNRQNFRKRRQT